MRPVECLGRAGLRKKECLGAGVRPTGPGTWLCAAAIVFLFILLRWNNYNAPLIRDEGEYAYAAQLLRHGLTPYQDSFLQKPPMVVYTYLLSNLAAPGVFWFPRVLAALFVGAATVLLGGIARREFGPGTGLTAMALFTPMVLLPEIEQFHANTEMFLLLPLLGAIAVYSHHRRDGGGFGAWFLSGLLGSIAFWYKYTCLPLLVLLFACWSWETLRAGRRSLEAAGTQRSGRSPVGLRWGFAALRFQWLGLTLGALASSVAVLGLFLVRDGGRHFWQCTIEFNRFYAHSINFAPDLFEARLEWFWTHWWLLFLLLPALALAWTPRVGFWLAMFLVSWVTTNGSGYGQYYLLVMPFWALLSAVALRGVSAKVAARFSWPEPGLRFAFSLITVLLVCWPDRHSVALSQEAFAHEKLAGSNPFLESALVARRVAALSAPGDSVLVAGSEPQILVYAHRFSPTRFVITAPLMMPSPLAAGFQQEAIRALRDRPPALVVLARSNTSWLMEENSPREFPQFLYQMLNEKYHPVGGYVMEGTNGRWEEPLPETALTNATLILFRPGRQH